MRDANSKDETIARHNIITRLSESVFSQVHVDGRFSDIPLQLFMTELVFSKEFTVEFPVQYSIKSRE